MKEGLGSDATKQAKRPKVNKSGRRDVAQLGSAPRLGRGGRTFKSCHPDHLLKLDLSQAFLLYVFTYQATLDLCNIHTFS